MRALSRHFRGNLVSALRQAAQAGELHRVTRPGDVDNQLNTLMATEWVVYRMDCSNTPTRWCATWRATRDGSPSAMPVASPWTTTK
ncbi:hypothetical protein KG088_17220 [Halomonas sp. TRM85114]|nr:hypothetical protein [Halomonas jincaotanensis]